MSFSWEQGLLGRKICWGERSIRESDAVLGRRNIAFTMFRTIRSAKECELHVSGRACWSDALESADAHEQRVNIRKLGYEWRHDHRARRSSARNRTFVTIVAA
jgi:hypothetical protein